MADELDEKFQEDYQLSWLVDWAIQPVGDEGEATTTRKRTLVIHLMPKVLLDDRFELEPLIRFICTFKEVLLLGDLNWEDELRDLIFLIGGKIRNWLPIRLLGWRDRVLFSTLRWVRVPPGVVEDFSRYFLHSFGWLHVLLLGCGQQWTRCIYKVYKKMI